MGNDMIRKCVTSSKWLSVIGTFQSIEIQRFSAPQAINSPEWLFSSKYLKWQLLFNCRIWDKPIVEVNLLFCSSNFGEWAAYLFGVLIMCNGYYDWIGCNFYYLYWLECIIGPKNQSSPSHSCHQINYLQTFHNYNLIGEWTSFEPIQIVFIVTEKRKWLINVSGKI